MLEQLSAASAFARAAAANNGGDNVSNSYQQLLSGLSGSSPVTSAASALSSLAAGASAGSGSFWEKDFKLFANSMTSQPQDTSHNSPPVTGFSHTPITSLSLSTDLTPTLLPGAATLPPTLTPSPSLHTPSPGIAAGQHTPSPSLGHPPSSPSTPGGSLGGLPTPSPGGTMGGHPTASPGGSLGGLPTPSPGGTGQDIEAAQMLWARYLESTLQQPGS